jgi:hypothetical protein
VKDEGFDLEGELHAGRSEPRSEFVTSLAGDVRSRVRRVRVGLWLALAGLVVVAVASFGGIGAAATTKHQTAASAQYHRYHPKTAKFTPKTVQAQHQQGTQAVAKTSAPKTSAPKTSSQLPFTGLALWVPLAVGLLLIAFGVALRTRAKRHGPGAH